MISEPYCDTIAHQTRFPIEEIRAAHEQLGGGSNVGKVVVTF